MGYQEGTRTGEYKEHHLCKSFISVEGKGGEAGKVDVIDLKTNSRVGSASVGKQAGGIIFWKME